MYFVPNDNYVKGQIEYDSKIYLNYVDDTIDSSNSLDDVFDIDFQEETDGSLDVFHLSDNFDEFGNIHIHVITVDDHGNTYVNRSQITYEYIFPEGINRITAPLENAYIEFNENSFSDEARVLVYENLKEDFDVSRDNIVLSNFITIQSNTELNSEAHIEFGLNHISTDYSLDHIGIGKFDNNQIYNLPSNIKDNKVNSNISSLGTYLMVYNEEIDHDEDNILIPTSFNIESCYPNPFNPIVSINYNLDVKSEINVKVYNILGQEIKTLYTGSKNPGNYTLNWDGTNNEGNLMPSGSYFIELSNYKSKDIKAVTLLK